LSSTSIKDVLLIDTKDRIGVDRWYLNLAFFMDTTKYDGMTPLLPLEIPHIWSLTLIWIGGAPSPMSKHGSLLVFINANRIWMIPQEHRIPL
jgi:hypothetical protein